MILKGKNGKLYTKVPVSYPTCKGCVFSNTNCIATIYKLFDVNLLGEEILDCEDNYIFLEVKEGI